MKKRIISLVLDLVMCVGLSVPALAVPVLPPEVDVVEPTDVTPKYAVYEVSYTIDMDNNTYADVLFLVSERGGTACFEEVKSISFYNTNPNGSHWKIVEHSYSIRGDQFCLHTTVVDMEGDKPSQVARYFIDFYLFPSQVVYNNLSAEDEDAVFLIPDSVRVGYPEEMKNTLSAKDGDAVFLIPDSVSISYPEESITLKAEIEFF